MGGELSEFTAHRFSFIIPRVMPIPDLNEHGFLPEGIHDCTLEEIGVRFGRFQTSDRRVRLFSKLCELVKEEQMAGATIEMFINGSFTTAQTEPGDIDLVIVLPPDYTFGEDVAPYQYNAISKASLQRRYPFDVSVLFQNSRQCHDQVAFFCKTREGQRKGILRIKL